MTQVAWTVARKAARPADLDQVSVAGILTSTTQRYIDLAGVRLRAEAEPAEARTFGVPVSKVVRVGGN